MNEDPAPEEWTRFCDKVERLQGTERGRQQTVFAMPFSFGTFKGWLKPPDPNDSDNWVLYKKLQNAWRLVQLIAIIEDSADRTSEHSMMEHFKNLYGEMQKKWKAREGTAPMADMIGSMGKEYRDLSSKLYKKDDLTLFKTTLSFVLYYYYHSWNVYGHFSLCDTGDIKKQVDLLMGDANESGT